MASKPRAASGRRDAFDLVVDSAHQIWLAGLGAFAKAQNEGARLFDALVKEGEAVRAQMGKLAGTQIDEMGQTAAEAWHRLGHAVDEGVAKSLNKMGIPTQRELQALSRDLARLNDRVEALVKGSARARRVLASPTAGAASRTKGSSRAGAAKAAAKPARAARPARKVAKRSGV